MNARVVVDPDMVVTVLTRLPSLVLGAGGPGVESGGEAVRRSCRFRCSRAWDERPYGREDVVELEWFANHRALALVDQRLRAVADVARREECPAAQVGLQRCGEMEEDVAADVGDAQIKKQHVEMRRPQEVMRGLSGECGDDIVAGPRERDRQCAAD